MERTQIGASWRRMRVWHLIPLLLLVCPPAAGAQQIDILLKGGHVIDPRNGIDTPMDVAIADGRILQVAREMPAQNARRVVDASGLYVTPGLIDLHAHFGNYHPRFPPDGFTFRAGVTTAVDAGTVGWRNYELIQDIVETARTRILVFLSIVGSKGMLEGDHGDLLIQDYSDYDPVMTAGKARQHPDVIVGIKVWKPRDMTGVERAVEAGRLADIPVMIDLNPFTPDDPDALEKLLLQVFRPGDIYTHMFSRTFAKRIIDENGNLKPFIRPARERGIVFDIGHGGGAFSWAQAMPTMRQGFFPDVISTDIHQGSINAGMKDMANVMSKFLAMGMSLQQVIEASTWKPAQVIKREDLGHLSVGAEADVAVFNLREGEFGFLDAQGWLNKGTRKLEAELTLRAGEVVWDLNGLAATRWDAAVSSD